MSDPFNFDEWARAAKLSKEAINALTREKLTDRINLVTLGKNPEDIKDLNLPVGERIHLKAALEGLSHPKGRAGMSYENVDINRTCSKQAGLVNLDSSYVQPIAWHQDKNPDYDYVKMDGIKQTAAGDPNKGPWLIGEVGRAETEKMLRDRGHHRSFVIRQRNQSGSYAMSVLYNGKVTHFPITKTSRGFNIGQFDHRDLSAVVTYYTHNAIIVDGTEEIRLGMPLRIH